MEEMRKLNSEELEKADGGTAEAFDILRQELQGALPLKVQEKLKSAKSDMETCRILADNGIDVEKIEKKIANAGFDQIKIGLQEVSDDALTNVAGGWKTYDAEVRCRCGNGDRDEFSYQFWASSLYGPRTKKYRCKKCNSYMKVTYDWAYEHAEIEYYE